MDHKAGPTSDDKGRNLKDSDDEDSNVCAPRKSRERKKNKIANRTEIGLIRKRIFKYYEEEKESPTISTILAILKDDGLIYDREYLQELLHKISFRYIRCQSPSRRHFLVERSDLGCRRIEYLRQIREYRAEHRNIYFMHETFMEDTVAARRANRFMRVEIPSKIDKTERLVIVHFGGQTGLSKGAFTTIKSDSPTGDHFSEVNQPRFEKWVNDNVKDKLQINSVICVSNPSYQSIQKDKMPRDMFVDIKDVQGWLRRHNIEFKEDSYKASLLELARKARLEPVYVFDEILKGLGHTVLRVPPHHADLNPLEFVWVDIDKKIAQNHKDVSFQEKRKIWDKLFTEYTPAEWQKWDEQVKNNENEYFDYIYKLDDIHDDIIERYEKDSGSDSETCESDCDQSDSLSE